MNKKPSANLPFHPHAKKHEQLESNQGNVRNSIADASDRVVALPKNKFKGGVAVELDPSNKSGHHYGVALDVQQNKLMRASQLSSSTTAYALQSTNIVIPAPVALPTIDDSSADVSRMSKIPSYIHFPETSISASPRLSQATHVPDTAPMISAPPDSAPAAPAPASNKRMSSFTNTADNIALLNAKRKRQITGGSSGDITSMNSSPSPTNVIKKHKHNVTSSSSQVPSSNSSEKSKSSGMKSKQKVKGNDDTRCNTSVNSFQDELVSLEKDLNTLATRLEYDTDVIHEKTLSQESKFYTFDADTAFARLAPIQKLNELLKSNQFVLNVLDEDRKLGGVDQENENFIIEGGGREIGGDENSGAN